VAGWDSWPGASGAEPRNKASPISKRFLWSQRGDELEESSLAVPYTKSGPTDQAMARDLPRHGTGNYAPEELLASIPGASLVDDARHLPRAACGGGGDHRSPPISTIAQRQATRDAGRLAVLSWSASSMDPPPRRWPTAVDRSAVKRVAVFSILAVANLERFGAAYRQRVCSMSQSHSGDHPAGGKRTGIAACRLAR